MVETAALSHDALLSCLVLAVVVGALVFARMRGLFMRMAIEAALLVLIATFLFWRGTSPLPHLGSMPLGLAGAWARVLAVSWWLIGARLVVNAMVIVRGRDPRSREARLFSELTAAVIYIATAIIILNSIFDLNVKGLLVTSGVIAIVLGLALQSTLADVFSGIAVGLERPFHVGDRVSVGDGVEGLVVEMNWRSLRIRTDGDDLATIPNSIVAKGQIINRSVPTKRRAAVVEITTSAYERTDQVIELMRQAALLCPMILPSPEPSITIGRSGLYSATYGAHFYVADSPDLGTARSMFLRQTRRMFRHAGIGRPAPMSETELLGSLVLFDALSAAELDSLVKAMTRREVEVGETIFEQDAPATSAFVIATGVLETSRRHGDAIEHTVGRIGAGEYIGELSLITNTPRSCTMKALTRARVLELPGSCLTSLLQSNPALNAAMERAVQRGLESRDRDDAARAEHPSEPEPDLVARIKAFFGAGGPA